jgi:8-oxo-dGTP diphosphatase
VTVSSESSPPAQLAAFTMTLLHNNDRYLMLQRSPSKRFAPNRWTGIGGRVESHEIDDLNAAALREIAEETGISPDQVQNLTLRRVLVQQRPEHPITVLLYFTGEVASVGLSPTDEGTLHWLTQEEVDSVDVIENTRAIIPHLIQDMNQDPTGNNGVISGAADFSREGELKSIVWSR